MHDKPFYGQKRIEGKVYNRYEITYTKKSSAQAEAKKLRKIGWSVRIIKERPYERPSGKEVYCLYVGGKSHKLK